jgi:hypothetical protein
MHDSCPHMYYNTRNSYAKPNNRKQDSYHCAEKDNNNSTCDHVGID